MTVLVTNPFWVAGDEELTYAGRDFKRSGRSGQLLDLKQPRAEWSAAYELKRSPSERSPIGKRAVNSSGDTVSQRE